MPWPLQVYFCSRFLYHPFTLQVGGEVFIVIRPFPFFHILGEVSVLSSNKAYLCA